MLYPRHAIEVKLPFFVVICCFLIFSPCNEETMAAPYFDTITNKRAFDKARAKDPDVNLDNVPAGSSWGKKAAFCVPRAGPIQVSDQIVSVPSANLVFSARQIEWLLL